VSEVCKNIRIGKILIQTNQQTGEPEVSWIKISIFECSN
jgi:uridine kinase